jgi:hypothetical protein
MILRLFGLSQWILDMPNSAERKLMKQITKFSGSTPATKLALVVAMYAGAALITCSGALFLVYSFAQNIRLNVFNLTIPGFAVALLMLFFGVRSFFSVRKLGQAILKDMPRLSLSLFKSRPIKGKSV